VDNCRCRDSGRLGGGSAGKPEVREETGLCVCLSSLYDDIKRELGGQEGGLKADLKLKREAAKWLQISAWVSYPFQSPVCDAC